MTNEIEYAPGVRSSMRATLKGARRAGYLMIASGVVMAAAMLIIGRGYELVPFATLLVTMGPAMITGLGYAKAVQSRAESGAEGK